MDNTTPATLDQIRAAIKPLEWKDMGQNVYRAKTATASYTVDQFEPMAYLVTFPHQTTRRLNVTLLKAKALCQAHYVELVMKAFK